MKVQRNTYEPSPKSEVDFVPNWRLIEKRQLWLQYPTETCFSSWYWLLLCVACQWCAQRQWFNAIFSQNLASKFPQVKLDRFYGFVPPTHFQEQVGWGSWLVVSLWVRVQFRSNSAATEQGDFQMHKHIYHLPRAVGVSGQIYVK